MKIIEQSHEIINIPQYILTHIEDVARTCYQSHDRTKEGSAIMLVKNLIDRGHEAMIEFCDITVKFITNRGISHELVRHRLCSFAQESTRYVKYNDMKVIKPVWYDNSTPNQQIMWLKAMEQAQNFYRDLLNEGWKAEQARDVLPNALKTEIIVKANLREWRQVFHLRCAKAAHPQMRALMIPLLKDLIDLIPIVFDDIYYV